MHLYIYIYIYIYVFMYVRKKIEKWTSQKSNFCGKYNRLSCNIINVEKLLNKLIETVLEPNK